MNAIGAERDDPRLQSYSDWNLGWIEATRGNALTGVLHCTRSLQRSPDPLNSAYSTGWLGFCHRENGDYVQAIAHLERSIEALRGFGYSRLIGWFSGWLADAYLASGRRDDARASAAEALEVSRAVAYPWAIAVATRAAGRISEAAGDTDEARGLIEDALEMFAAIDAGFDGAATRVDLARLESRRGDTAVALDQAEIALAAFRAMAVPVYEERTALFLAALKGPDDSQPPRSEPEPESGPDRLRMTSLGRFAAEIGGSEIGDSELGGDSGRELLAALLAARGSPTHRDRLMAWLWPGSAPGAASHALSTTSDALRSVVGPDRLRVEGSSLRLVLQPGDEWDALDLLRASGASDGAEPPEILAERLAAQAAPLFPEWPTAEWARPMRLAYHEAATQTRARLAKSLLAVGRHDEARVQFAQLADASPQEEAWHRGLMRCHAAEGETALALRQFHACRSVLRQMQGVDPSPETQSLYLELLQGR